MLRLMQPVKSGRSRHGRTVDLNDSIQTTGPMMNILATEDSTEKAPDNVSFSTFQKTRKSTPTPLIDAKVIKQRDMPTSLFADFIESGTTGDIDIFLTRVCQMPSASQNKLLQEKILFLNEKLVNVFEEIGNVSRFHSKTSRFLKVLRNKINQQRQTQLQQN